MLYYIDTYMYIYSYCEQEGLAPELAHVGQGQGPEEIRGRRQNDDLAGRVYVCVCDDAILASRRARVFRRRRRRRRRRRQGRRIRRRKVSVLMASAVNEEDSERDRATQEEEGEGK